MSETNIDKETIHTLVERVSSLEELCSLMKKDIETLRVQTRQIRRDVRMH